MKRLNKTLTTLFLLGTLNSVFAEEIVPTAQEEKAVITGLQGSMQRLADPAWIQLAAEKGEGCYLTKEILYPEGYTYEFEGVPSTCVSWSMGMGKAYMFFPTRLKDLCDQAGLAYNECVN